MTDREKAIVMAYTGACMLTGDKFQIFHKYIEDIMGKPIYTHEFAFIADEIRRKSEPDFISLCKNEYDSCEWFNKGIDPITQTITFTFSDGSKKVVKPLYDNNTFRESILNKFMKKE